MFKTAAEMKRQPNKPPKQSTTEDAEQEAVIEYCTLKGIKVVHIPNESKRTPVYGAKLKRIGLREGFPDLAFPTPRKGYHGLYIELKRDRTCKPTAEQWRWINYLNGQGYRATVCYGASEAIEEINWYFNSAEVK
ncbi:MAG: VRR-NUC domain-containing protein [Clostridia bacterium]|nr:VRR-NUC domain-containing protein [Clostridia bacterium]